MTDSVATSNSSADSSERANLLRQLVDGLVCLALAVIVFRTFAVEGYIISTGSMAPNLLGFHKRVSCPTCHFSFAVGVPHDRVEQGPQPAVCPNCGRRRIKIDQIPRNEGDQLLVYKHAFTFRPPRRWESAVFQNPNKPTEIFVKRIVGMPGESIQVIDGDVFVNGKIQRKNFKQQKAVRVPIHDLAHEPTDDPEWQSRWIGDDGWTRSDNGYQFRATRNVEQQGSAIRWVRYRHWIRSGGLHKSSVAVGGQPSTQIDDKTIAQVHYERATHSLSCTGVLHASTRDRLIAKLNDPEMKQAIMQLESASHISPILDSYGYNRESVWPMRNRVADLMLSVRLTNLSGDGQFLVRMAYHKLIFAMVFDFSVKQLQIRANNNPQPLRTYRLELDDTKSLLVEASVMDQQVLVAINDKQIAVMPFSNQSKDVTSQDSSPIHPVQFGSRHLQVDIDSIKLFRDVYYTSGAARHGISKPFQLRGDEYFVLGDNSPVSHDSREWETATVKKHQLVGKPFLVHLPSRPGRIKIGNYQANIRIPDISRIRYIH